MIAVAGEPQIDRHDDMRKIFKFLNPGKLVDGDLELVLVKKIPANPAKKHVPCYQFQMRKVGGTGKIGNISWGVGSARHLQCPGQAVSPRGHAQHLDDLKLLAGGMGCRRQPVTENDHADRKGAKEVDVAIASCRGRGGDLPGTIPGLHADVPSAPLGRLAGDS